MGEAAINSFDFQPSQLNAPELKLIILFRKLLKIDDNCAKTTKIFLSKKTVIWGLKIKPTKIRI